MCPKFISRSYFLNDTSGEMPKCVQVGTIVFINSEHDSGCPHQRYIDGPWIVRITPAGVKQRRARPPGGRTEDHT